MASVVETVDLPRSVGGLCNLRGAVELALFVLGLEWSGISEGPGLLSEAACCVILRSRSLLRHFLIT
jgi:hypothetical protein